MPPCVRIRPSSTVMLPGPTCLQPVRSFPLKSGFQAGACGCAAANANRVETAAAVSIVIRLRGFMARFYLERSSQAEAQTDVAPAKKKKNRKCGDSGRFYIYRM